MRFQVTWEGGKLNVFRGGGGGGEGKLVNILGI